MPDLSKIIHELSLKLDESAIITKAQALRAYECDGLSAYQQPPMLVVIPNTLEQLKHILSCCKKYNAPVIARGAGTGLSGGALPTDKSVVISLARFNKILDIDTHNRFAVVQPGVRNLAISEAVQEYNLYYAPDPSSQIACSIGGNVAENAGGVHCLKYGLTVHNVTGLKIMTIDGELIELGGKFADSAGYDFLALVTGSEGLLGIIVEVTVKLLPRPHCAQVILAAFDKTENAGQAVTEIISNGIIPAGLELMDAYAIRAAEDHVHAGYPRDAQAILLCELDGDIEEVEQGIRQVTTLLNSCGATSLLVSHSEAHRQKLWAGRKAAFPAVGRISPDYYCMDGTIPRKHLATVLGKINALSTDYDLPVANVFHAGDGNLHPLILYDANIPGELEKTERFGADILRLCIEMGGTITGEHGVGIEKIDQMCYQFSQNEINMFHAIKYSFDAKGLLNPGKAIPTLHRCAELGAMHVHNGELPFPELERF
ncbi:Glycolate dehydrogenase, subunit GlcD [hydrothermal vent metagenome]|uniref:Glycolate dehydrogenase, subunit GlcD n=1 Tax=hydrothermal vent metagenome TaxID=652676 RepID=A0A3B0ZBZ7_9ZZZZ